MLYLESLLPTEIWNHILLMGQLSLKEIIKSSEINRYFYHLNLTNKTEEFWKTIAQQIIPSSALTETKTDPIDWKVRVIERCEIEKQLSHLEKETVELIPHLKKCTLKNRKRARDLINAFYESKIADTQYTMAKALEWIEPHHFYINPNKKARERERTRIDNKITELGNKTLQAVQRIINSLVFQDKISDLLTLLKPFEDNKKIKSYKRLNGDKLQKLMIPINCYTLSRITLLQTAADGGHLEAQFEAGYTLLQPYYCYEDMNKGLKYLINAARQGHHKAQLKLGNFYEKGLNSSDSLQWSPNMDNAMHYYKLAVAGNDPEIATQAKARIRRIEISNENNTFPEERPKKRARHT